MKKASMREIKAVKEELEKELKKIRRNWLNKNPRPSFENELVWEAANISPQRAHTQKETDFLEPKKRQLSELIFDAKMGLITSEELYKKAKNFLGARS